MEQKEARQPLGLFFALAPALSFALLFLLFAGYRYGYNNAHEGNQLARRLIDGGYLSRDWYTNTASGTSMRLASSWVLAKLGLLLGIQGASWFLYLILALSFGGSVYLLAETLFPHPALAALLALGIQLPAPGAAHLWMDTLEAQTFAMPFALFGLGLCLRRRWRLSGLMFGIATLFHHLIGLEFLLLAVIGMFSLKPRMEDFLEIFGGFLPLGGINLLFLLANLWTHRANGQQALEILTLYRNPWHYLPFVGPHVDRFRTLALILLLGFGAWWGFRKQERHRAVAGWAIAMSLLMLLAIPLTLHPFPLFVKFQFFRLAPFLQALAYLYVGALLEHRLRRAISLPRLRWLGLPIALFGAVSIADANTALSGNHFLPSNLRRFQVKLSDLPQDPWMQACNWIRKNTEPDALFLSQPEPEGFRTYAERATVVDFKNFVFMDDEMIEWHKRLRDLTGIESFPPDDWERYGTIRKRFIGLPPERLEALSKRYAARYLLTERAALPFHQLYRNAVYHVYDLTPDQ